MINKSIFLITALYGLFFILGGVLPPILAYFHFYDISGQITFLFSGSCHQQSDRSFWISGYPMSLCARCIGVYLGTFCGAVFFLFNKNKILSLKYIYIIIVLISVDIILNYLLNFDTGNIIRFIIGIMIGTLFVTSLKYLSIYLNKKEKND